MRGIDGIRQALERRFKRARAGHAFALIGVAVVGVGALVIRDLRHANQETQQLYSSSVHGLDLIGELQYQTQEARRSMQYALTTTDANLQVDYVDKSRLADVRVAGMMQEQMALIQTEPEAEPGQQFMKDWSHYLKIRDEVIASILEGSIKEAVERDQRDGVTGFNRVRDDLQDIKRLYRKQAERELEAAHASADRTISRVMIILCLTMLFAALAVRRLQKDQMLAVVQQSEARLSGIIQSALDAVITFDPEGLITGWNPQAEATFGWTPSEAIGRCLSETIIPARFRGAHLSELQHFRETGKGSFLNARVEITALHSDGHEFAAELAVSEARTGKTHALSAFVRDITQRKRAEAELRQAKEAAEAASRAKSEFLANMSHEIRTPMNGILGMTELTLDTELTTEQREYLSMVKSSADSLLTVINDVLDFSKIEAGKLDLDPIEFHLRDCLAETVKTLAVRAHQKGLELACDVRPEVPKIVVGDPTRIRQIIVNLIGNALKFTEHGEVVVRVATERQEDDGLYLHFSVSDTGIGISREKQGAIFEAFSQADTSTTRKYGGTGLGLTISACLIAMMKGRIWVESEVGRGSTFHFIVHFGRAESPAAEMLAPEPPSLRHLPVLVVDDNPTNRRILEDTLGRWGMKPALAGSGEEALSTLLQAKEAGEPFQLLLIDAHMPEMDGFTLVERIRRDRDLTGATIMMLSSGGQRGDAARCRELGMAAYLTKPIQQSELREAVVSALSIAGPQARRAEPPKLVTRHSLREGRQRLRVLLAEDNAVNQALTVRLLEKQGHEVVVAGDGHQALAAMEQQSFDLVLMDVQMPEMDGFEATVAIREKEKATRTHVPIIAMTAHAMKGDRERCLAAGMDGYLSKPINARELIEAIDARAIFDSWPNSEQARDVKSLPQSIGDEAEVLDWAAALNQVEGDHELLVETVSLFLENCPKQLEAIRMAVRERDAKALMEHAHGLKGGLGIFAAKASLGAALRLETISRQDRLDEADDAYAALERELARLKSALRTMLKASVELLG